MKYLNTDNGIKLFNWHSKFLNDDIYINNDFKQPMTKFYSEYKFSSDEKTTRALYNVDELDMKKFFNVPINFRKPKQ